MDELLTESDLAQLASGARRYNWPWCRYQGTHQDCFGRLCSLRNGAALSHYAQEEREFWELFLALINLGHPLRDWNERQRDNVTVLDVLLAYVEPLAGYLEREALKELEGLQKRPLATQRPKLTVTPDFRPEDLLATEPIIPEEEKERTR